jgi:hypothetical protein
MNKFTSETLKCPKCGTGIEEWFYLEHVVAYRRVLSASKGVVHIFNAYNIEDRADVLNTYSIESNSKPANFFCRECRTVIPIPVGLTLEFDECEG